MSGDTEENHTVIYGSGGGAVLGLLVLVGACYLWFKCCHTPSCATCGDDPATPFCPTCGRRRREVELPPLEREGNLRPGGIEPMYQ